MALIDSYKSVRMRTEKICEPLIIEDYLPQGALFSSPVKWHIAHTSWFFETFILMEFLDGYKVFHPSFNFLFNSYYNAVGQKSIRSDRGLMTRPSVSEVFAYRAYVDAAMEQLLSNSNSQTLNTLLEIGINHEQQHQELIFTDLKNNFSLNPTYPIYKDGFNLVGDHNREEGYLKVKSGNYQIGFEGDGFSFDNEHGRHTVYINDLCISKALVTNGEFLDFMEDGGYQRHELWLDEGWSWVNTEGITQPLYWKNRDNAWFQFSLGGLIPIDKNAQLAHISHYEAAAYAEWKGMRLPTEFEWEVASKDLKWGSRWEHTSSAYLPYPGYKKPKGAVGEYNGKFMMNQMVLRGASNATPEAHSRSTYRNFFHPNTQWQFTGIRLAKDE